MAGINPTSGISSPLWSHGLRSAGPNQDAAGGFGKMLQNYISQVDKAQQASATAVQDLLAGKSQDIMPVVSAVAKADLSFKLLLGVRNKVIEAYKQTMNMQV